MLEQEQSSGRDTIAFVGGTLIDGTGKGPLHDSVVTVEGDVLRAAGRRGEVQISPGAEIVDVSGKTIIPGLIDCHVHISWTTSNLRKRLLTPQTVEIFQAAEMMKRTLHAGFTTVRDAGTLNDPGLSQAVEMGLVEGPRLVVAGALIQTGGHLDLCYPSGVSLPLMRGETCDGVPEVQRAARKVLREGADFIKICTSGGTGLPVSRPEHTEWTGEELKAIVREASARGKAVMAHAISTKGIKNAIRAGAWSVEHGSCLDDGAVQMLLDSGTYLVPTLSVDQAILARRPGDGWGLTDRDQAELIEKYALESFKKAAEAGVKIAVGTDALNEEMHGNNASELELFVRHGLTPMRAIVAATKTASEACRVDDRVGTLEAGKLADLLVVDGNPIEDISILEDKSRLLLIMKEGRTCIDRLTH